MNPDPTLYEALEKIFHEPSRLAIMSALCAADDGLSFAELKETCSLTDGNLNRHLKVLEDSEVVRIRKTFVDSKPRTTVRLSKTGLARFNEYLAALEEVLQTARAALAADPRKPRGFAPFSASPVRAT